MRTRKSAFRGALSAVGLNGSKHVRINVTHNDVFDEQYDEDQDHRRYVDAAEVRQQVANGAQQWLGDPVQKLADHVHRLIARVDDVERDQPRQYRGGDQQPDVNLQYEQNDVENRAHGQLRGGAGK